MSSERWSVSWHGTGDNFIANKEAIVEQMVQEASQRYFGYQLCADCEGPVTDEVAKITGGRCPPCFQARHERYAREIEVLVDGARSILRPGGSRRHTGSRGSKDTRRKAEQAKRRALRRLRWARPDTYALFLAQERARVGLDPYPLSTALGTMSSPDTYDPDDEPQECVAPSDAPEPERGQPLR